MDWKYLLVTQLPTTVICLVGIVLAVLNLSRYRQACVLAIISLTYMLFNVWLGRWLNIKALEIFGFENALAYFALRNILDAGFTSLLIGATISNRTAGDVLSADAALSDEENLLRSEERKAGIRNFVIGLCLTFLGAVVTAVGYALAANRPGGGSYIVTYGLVIAGIAQAIRGLIQMSR